ncbi:MAG TPA: sulfotransferase [Acidimicrobiales bacterium]|nr:sulfotransferase [Acidimicrobiales bacterium]
MTAPSPSCRIAVHIGYHKTATTWFQQIALGSHPAITPLLGGSEFGVVASDAFVRQLVFARDSEFDAGDARRLFTERAGAAATDPGRTVVVSAERLSGHAASGGYDSIRIADRVHATLPEAKVFWMLRHQAEAIRSEYKQIVVAGWPGAVAATLAPEPRMKTTGIDLAYWEYDRLLSAYARRFGRDNVKVVDYGEFTRDPGAVLARLAAFLEVAPWDLSAEEMATRVNEGESDRETRTRQRLNHVTRTELNPYPPVDVPNRVSARIVKLSRALPGGRPLFPAGFDDWVGERYRESNRRLADDWGVVLTRSGPAA